MKKLVLILLACAAVFAAAPGQARAAQCGLPDRAPWWIDFADGSVPFWQTFAKPGVIAAAANQVFPPQLRAAGAHTVYWDMYLNNRVGTPAKPAAADDVVARANRLFDAAVVSSNCATPLMAENELFGASLVSPWSDTNSRYRANVLLFLRTLAGRGARPFLLVNSTPYTGGEARDWWLDVAKVADLVREDYFPAPAIYAERPLLANRFLRTAFRTSISDFTAIGIPPSRLGIMLGFHTERGQGGREGLERQAWFQTVKWQALSARQVARETKIASVWSWGWASWGQVGVDADKSVAACVYLWTRAHDLCDGPAAAGRAFDRSLGEGQIRLQSGVQCTFAGRRLSTGAIAQLQALTGDREAAYTALLARLAESQYAHVSSRQILAAERVVIATRFHGSGAAYRTALAKAHASIAVARGVIGDELRRAQIESTLRPGRPSAAEIASFYLAYPDILVRTVHVTPAAPWLGGRRSGLALSSVAPPSVFSIPGGRKVGVLTMQGRYVVRAAGEATPLGAVPLDRARAAIGAALAAYARGAAFESWSADRQAALLRTAICRGDALPGAGALELAAFLPFLEPNG